jgi:hypothetical protein
MWPLQTSRRCYILTYPWQQLPLSRVFDYWRSLYEKHGGIPPRALFNPMRIPKDLPEIQIFDLVEDEITFRVSGTAADMRAHHANVPGTQVRGLYIPEQYDRIVKKLKFLSQTGHCGYSRMLRNVKDTFSIPMQALILPFAPTNDGVTSYLVRLYDADEDRIITTPDAPPMILLTVQFMTKDGEPADGPEDI